MNRTAAPLRTALLGGLVAVVGGCLSPITLEDGSQVELAVTDPELAAELESLVAVMYFNPGGDNGCAALLDEDLDALHARQPRANQAFPARPEEEGGGTHTFGNVGASGDYSFLLLGSVRPRAALSGDAPLLAARGSVVAAGCEELQVLQNHRYDLPLTLFPAGLR